MKNAKKASGISYSNIAIVLIFTALSYGIYQKVFQHRSEVTSADAIEHQVEQEVFQSDDLNLGQKTEKKPELKPTEQTAVFEEVSDSVAEQAFGTSIVTQEEPVQVKSLKSWSFEDYKKLMKRTQSELPVLTDFKKLNPKEVHHTPEILNRAGTKLGLIAEVLDANPDFVPIAQEFYQDCLVRKDLPTSIRALCLANHRNLRVSQGDSPDWHEAEIRTTTSEIRELAEHIPLK